MIKLSVRVTDREESRLEYFHNALKLRAVMERSTKTMDREITLDDLSGMLDGDYSHVYMHVTAGHYGQHSSDYHLNIDSDGSIYLTKPFDETPAATWHRNTGSIAVTLDCEPDAQLFGDGTTDFGSEPPTSEQIECLAQVLATISNATGLPIDAEHMMTHAEAAELDGYGPNTTCERWDLWTLPDSREWGSGGDYIRGKAIWYQQEWENELGGKLYDMSEWEE